MTVTPKVLIAAKTAEATQTTQYTASGCKTIIDKFTAHNYAGTAQSLAVHLVTAGGTAGNENLMSGTKTLQSGETFTFPSIVGHILNTSGFISTIAGGTASINIRASGREIT